MLDSVAQILQRRVGGDHCGIDLLAVGRQVARAGVSRRSVGCAIVATLTRATVIIVVLKNIAPLLYRLSLSRSPASAPSAAAASAKDATEKIITAA
jgi:TctA family transporter